MTTPSLHTSSAFAANSRASIQSSTQCRPSTAWATDGSTEQEDNEQRPLPPPSISLRLSLHVYPTQTPAAWPPHARSAVGRLPLRARNGVRAARGRAELPALRGTDHRLVPTRPRRPSLPPTSPRRRPGSAARNR